MLFTNHLRPAEGLGENMYLYRNILPCEFSEMSDSYHIIFRAELAEKIFGLRKDLSFEDKMELGNFQSILESDWFAEEQNKFASVSKKYLREEEIFRTGDDVLNELLCHYKLFEPAMYNNYLELVEETRKKMETELV